MGRKKSQQYVDNKVFYELLKQNKKLEKQKQDYWKALENQWRRQKNGIDIRVIDYQQSKIKNELGKIFLKICNGFICRPSFINYSWDRKDEMISDACFYMSNYVLKFSLKRKNPFAYFTQVCYNAFRQNLNKHKKFNETFQSIGYIENIFMKNNLGNNNEW